jgi:hypothetical protein
MQAERYSGSRKAVDEWLDTLNSLYVWAFLALLLVAAAFYSAVYFGNQYGSDNWGYYYTIVELRSLQYVANRPLELIYQAFPLTVFGHHPATIQAVLVVYKAIVGFLVFLLVRKLAKGDSLFAFACAAVYMTYHVSDLHLLGPLWMLHRFGTLAFVLLSCYFYVLYVERGVWWAILLSMGAVIVSILSYEGVFALVAGIPLLIFAYRRDFSRRTIVGTGLYFSAVIGASMNYVLPFLMGSHTYGTNYGITLDPLRIIVDLARQFRFLYADLFHLGPKRFFDYRLPAILTVLAGLGGIAVIRYKIRTVSVSNNPFSLTGYLIWILASIIVTVFALIPYLVAGMTAQVYRIHYFTQVGVGMTLVGLIWLLTSVVPNTVVRSTLRWISMGLLMIRGSTLIAESQQLDYYAAHTDLDSQSYFMRSLANVVPDTKEHTLIVFYPGENGPAPFYYGFGFQYGMAYFYQRHAMGVVYDGSLTYHDWGIVEEGIKISPTPLVTNWVGRVNEVYKWEEMIVITKDSSGRAVLLEQLPDPLKGLPNAENYNPDARIIKSYIPPRVQEIFPPILQP